MNKSLRFVVEIFKNDFKRRILDPSKFNPGDRLIMELKGHPKGRINVTYIPSDLMYNTEGDVYSIFAFVSFGFWSYYEKINRTQSHPFRFYEYNMSNFQKHDYQISLSGIIEVYLPKVWTIIILFLFLFSFFTTVKRFVPRVRRFLVGVSDNLLLNNTYESAKKVILATYFVGCFILMEVFKAILSTKLTEDIDHNIHSFDDIFKHSNMRIFFQGNAVFVNYLQAYRKDVLLEYERRFQKMKMG